MKPRRKIHYLLALITGILMMSFLLIIKTSDAAITISGNLSSVVTQEELRKIEAILSSTLKRLTSGLHVIESADDAEGLAVLDSINISIDDIQQSSRATQESIALLKLNEEGFGELKSILEKVKNLAQSTSRSSQQEAWCLIQQVNSVSSSRWGVSAPQPAKIKKQKACKKMKKIKRIKLPEMSGANLNRWNGIKEQMDDAIKNTISQASGFFGLQPETRSYDQLLSAINSHIETIENIQQELIEDSTTIRTEAQTAIDDAERAYEELESLLLEMDFGGEDDDFVDDEEPD